MAPKYYNTSAASLSRRKCVAKRTKLKSLICIVFYHQIEKLWLTFGYPSAIIIIKEGVPSRRNLQAAQIATIVVWGADPPSSDGYLVKSPIPWGVFQFYQQLGLARGLPTPTARCVGESRQK